MLTRRPRGNTREHLPHNPAPAEPEDIWVRAPSPGMIARDAAFVAALREHQPEPPAEAERVAPDRSRMAA